MFRGLYEHSVDAKGRLALPSAFRRYFEAVESPLLIITSHISSPCLVAYPHDAWEQFEKKVAKLPQFDSNVMMLRRLYIGAAMDCPIDRQGRVLVPNVLRAHAKLEKEVLWVGGIQTLEIWSKTSWDEHVESRRKDMGPALIDRLGDLGI
jgi:MraZ protein